MSLKLLKKDCDTLKDFLYDDWKIIKSYVGKYCEFIIVKCERWDVDNYVGIFTFCPFFEKRTYFEMDEKGVFVDKNKKFYSMGDVIGVIRDTYLNNKYLGKTYANVQSEVV